MVIALVEMMVEEDWVLLVNEDASLAESAVRELLDSPWAKLSELVGTL